MKETARPEQQMIEAFVDGIRNGEADHGYSLCQMLLSEGPNFTPDVLIDIVEGVLELSVLAGSVAAKEYLKEQWPILKRNHLRRLSRKTESKGS